MNRIIGTGIFIFMFLLVDFYLFQAFKIFLRGYSDSTQRTAKLVYWAVPILSVILIFSVFYLYPQYISAKTRNLLAASVFILYISKLVAAVFFLITDIVNLIRHYTHKVISPETADPKITRSEFLAKSTLAVGGAHLGLMAYGIISGAHDYRVRKTTLAIKGLPKAFDGLRLAQLSDIHSGSFFNKTAVNGGVDLLLAEKPDMVFFTGDLVNNEAKEINSYFDIFKRVKAPLGVYSTLGNHDYGDYIPWDTAEAKIKNLETLMASHKAMGWDLLMDENRAIKLNGETLGVLGIQNWGTGGFVKKGDLSKALAGTEEMSTKLLLSHDPSHWRAQVLGKTNIDVAFAGHTHGMQYGVEIGDFKWSPIKYKYAEWAGLYAVDDQKLYVNRGFGYLGFPGRVGILPEISIFTLKAV
jgi:uncharacterized protein